MATGRNQQGLADLDRARQGIVGVTGEDHVNPGHTARHLAVYVKAIMRQKHYKTSARWRVPYQRGPELFSR